LIFTVSNQSIFFTHVTWTVYDVGTGGAKLVGVYGPNSQGQTQPAVEIKHAWEPNGPQEGKTPETAGTFSCGACSDCHVGFGIKNMTANAGEGLGFRSFQMSQLYDDVRCGATCFDLDASYWTGMQYSCVTVSPCQHKMRKLLMLQ
jgi:hypothetical protein